MAACSSCGSPLLLSFEDSDYAVPDDLTLPCGCHYHWQCFLDKAAEVAESLSCPSCRKYLPPNQPGSSALPQATAILVRYHDEGGVEDNYNILPEVREEAYLAAHPGERPARAFLTLCAEGDVMGIVDLCVTLAGGGSAEGDDEEEDEDEEMEEHTLSVPQLLRYQDSLNGMKSGLHLAIERNQQEAFYLLLYLASRHPTAAFSADVLSAVDQVGLTRPEEDSEPDIRSLRDARGETAEAYAVRAGGEWAALAERGIFTLT